MINAILKKQRKNGQLAAIRITNLKILMIIAWTPYSQKIGSAPQQTWQHAATSNTLMVLIVRNARKRYWHDDQLLTHLPRTGFRPVIYSKRLRPVKCD